MRQLTALVKAAARDAGFDLVGVARMAPATHGDVFRQWLSAGRHAPMVELEAGVDVRTDPRERHPWAKTVVSLGLLTGAAGVGEDVEPPDIAPLLSTPPMGACSDAPSGARSEPDAARRQAAAELIRRSPALAVWPWIARYERGASYHRINDGKLNRFARRLRDIAPSVRFQPHIEHGAFFERDLAYQAGLGWVGKNNLVINPTHGSFFVLTSLFTDLDLEPDTPVRDHCLECRACLDACPTGALDGPHNLVVDKCLSARTISISGPMPAPYIEAAAGHLSGCDICQDACPWNRATAGPGPERWDAATLLDVLACTEDERRQLFDGSLVMRIPLSSLKRNALLAAGRILRAGSGAPRRDALDDAASRIDPADVPLLRRAVEAHRNAADPAVREAAVFALSAELPIG